MDMARVARNLGRVGIETGSDEDVLERDAMS